EITASTQRSPIIPRRRVIILSPGQPIPHGRPYRYHLKKRVGPLPTHRLAMRHYADHSSLDSSSEASSDFHSDASSDSSSRHSLSDHSSPDLPSTSAGPSRKRRRDSGYLADVEVDPSEVRLGVDVGDEIFEQPRSRRTNLEVDDDVKTSTRDPIVVSDDGDTPPMVPEVIPEPAQEERAMEVTYETLGDLVQRFHDHIQAIPVHRIHVIKGVQREQGHRIVGVESAVIALTERIDEL
ncbi:hypothetical protein Tco_0172017, partial [Tanacetum coccineum]